MTEKFVQVNTDGSGKKIRTEELVVGADTVEQQVISVADSAGTLIEGTVSPGNSSTAPLSGAAVFTGTWEDVKNYAFMSISVFADVASAIDGFSFQWSHDGTNQDAASGSSVYAASGRAFAITPRARYFRVVYTNGALAQATFRLGTVYHPNGTGLISRPLDQALDTENYAETVRSATDGYDKDGVAFVHAQARAARPGKFDTGLVVRDPDGTLVVDVLSRILDKLEEIRLQNELNS